MLALNEKTSELFVKIRKITSLEELSKLRNSIAGKTDDALEKAALKEIDARKIELERQQINQQQLDELNADMKKQQEVREGTQSDAKNIDIENNSNSLVDQSKDLGREGILEINSKTYIKKRISDSLDEIYIEVQKSRILYYSEIPESGKYYAEFIFDGDVMNGYISVPSKGYGKLTFIDAFERFGGVEKVHGFDASWNNLIGIKDNFVSYHNAFNEILLKSPGIEISEARKIAAFETATGKWCYDLGFKKVDVFDFEIEVVAKFR